METQANDLHNLPGKGWKHYFFEFFMLFLAERLWKQINEAYPQE